MKIKSITIIIYSLIFTVNNYPVNKNKIKCYDVNINEYYNNDKLNNKMLIELDSKIYKHLYQTLLNHEKSFYKEFADSYNDKRNIPQNDYIGNFYRLKYDQYYDIYAYHLTWLFGGNHMHFILFNKITKDIIDFPNSIFTKWFFGIEDVKISYPLIYYMDINLDKNPEIIIKEQVHNGTMYNGILEHVYEIKNNKISKLFTFESFSLLPFKDKSGFGINGFEAIKREIIPGKYNIKLKLILTNNKHKPDEDLGEIVMQKKGSYYGIIKINLIKDIKDNPNKDFMFTVVPGKTEELIRKGYTFYY